MFYKTLVFLLVCLTATNSKKVLNFTDFLNLTPDKFGILTYSRSNKGDYKNIKNHVHKYASMECYQMSQVSIVQIGLQNYTLHNLTKDSNFKRPLHFINKPYNSVDYRFYIPKQSKASVYFLIDIGTQITCNQLSDSFDQWKSKSLGDLAPIITIQGQSFSFDTAKSQFKQVKGGPSKRYFNLNLLDGAWISRFYLQLYYFQTCLQINQIRQIVIKQNECQDIALNFMVNSFFPQFIPQLIRIQNNVLKQLQTNSSQIRSSCFKKFVDIIGFNPMRIIDKKSSTEKHFKYQSKKYIVYAKRRQLQIRMKDFFLQKFQNFNDSKPLIQKFFIDQNLSLLVKDKKSKLQQLKKNRDNIVQLIQTENQQYQKNWKVILIFLLIYLGVMILLNSKLVKIYKNLMNKNQPQTAVQNSAQNELKPI